MGIEKINKSLKIDIKVALKDTVPQIFEDNKINFEKLKALLSGEIIEREDARFYFNWAGKSGLYKIIQSPAYGTLKPDKERSVDFDTTENIIIVGENLETLKLLLKPYFGKVKMIYIDPPYNTGKDFIYRDNFKEPLKDYLEKTGQIDSEGKKLTTNTEASGRYHSDWLNFMYPRLFLARSLLRDDGVIFISIDDNEVHNLRKIMDEIFGEENFVIQQVWENREGGGSSDSKHFKIKHEYILTYAKNMNSIKIKGVEIEDEDRYALEDEFVKERGKYQLVKLNSASIQYSPSLDYPINAPDGSKIFPSYGNKRACWRWSKEKVKWGFKNEYIVIKKDRDANWAVYTKQYLKADSEGNLIDRTKRPIGIISQFSTTMAAKQLEELFERKAYDYSKPYLLMKYLAYLSTETEDIILDFFAGSGTTGHAVWDLNKEDSGNRKFILVQLDEEVQDEEIKKDYSTVADICIERLKRVSEKYRKEIASASPRNNINGGNQDFGFKVFKLDKSNFNLKDEFEIQEGQDAEELKKKYLEWLGMFIDQPLVSGWQKIDVIYEIMLKEGLNLNSKIEQVKIKENNFYYIKDTEQNLDFYLCLEDKIETDTVEEIRTTKYKGKIFVFMDKALTDNDKINLSAFVRLKVI